MDFLKSLDIYGLSEHDLVFSQAAQDGQATCDTPVNPKVANARSRIKKEINTPNDRERKKGRKIEPAKKSDFYDSAEQNAMQLSMIDSQSQDDSQAYGGGFMAESSTQETIAEEEEEYDNDRKRSNKSKSPAQRNYGYTEHDNFEPMTPITAALCDNTPSTAFESNGSFSHDLDGHEDDHNNKNYNEDGSNCNNSNNNDDDSNNKYNNDDNNNNNDNTDNCDFNYGDTGSLSNSFTHGSPAENTEQGSKSPEPTDAAASVHTSGLYPPMSPAAAESAISPCKSPVVQNADVQDHHHHHHHHMPTEQEEDDNCSAMHSFTAPSENDDIGGDNDNNRNSNNNSVRESEEDQPKKSPFRFSLIESPSNSSLAATAAAPSSSPSAIATAAAVAAAAAAAVDPFHAESDLYPRENHEQELSSSEEVKDRVADRHCGSHDDQEEEGDKESARDKENCGPSPSRANKQPQVAATGCSKHRSKVGKCGCTCVL